MNVHFFFRQKNPNFHSIENLFTNLQQFLPESCNFVNIYLPKHNGIIARLKNIIFAHKNKGQINHITGDINYIALGLPRKSTILTIHDIFSATKVPCFKKVIIKLFWFWLPLRKVKYITTISEATKNDLVNILNVKPSKIKVIPNCFDVELLNNSHKFNNETPRILFIGTKPNKNLERTIRSIYNINCVLIIVGKLSDEQKKLLNEFQIKYENFYNIDRFQIINLYKTSDMLLFPSLAEGFGMPIIEAQAAKLPVITSTLEPMRTIAANGAILVDPYDENSIRRAVLELINNPSNYTSIVEKGCENVQKYHPQNIASLYFELYQSIENEIHQNSNIH